MKQGFTLIEMIAVIGIIALMSLLVMPSIINQIAEKKTEISGVTEKIIYSATELYMNDNSVDYNKTVGSVYCIKLEKIVNAGYLKTPLKDAKTGKQIDTGRLIRVEVNSYNEYDNFEILEKDDSVC